MKSATIAFLILAVLISPLWAKDTLVFSGPQNVEEFKKVLDMIYHPLGYTVKIRLLPGSRSLVMSDNGKTDGEVARTDIIEKSFQNLIQIPHPLSHLELVVFTQKNNISILNWQDLAPYKIGLIRGLRVFELPTKGMQQDFCFSVESLFKKLNSGRNDVALYFPDEGMATVNALGLKGITYLKPPLQRIPIYHYIHNKHRSLVPKVTAQIKILTQDGTVEKILAEERAKRALSGNRKQQKKKGERQ